MKPVIGRLVLGALLVLAGRGVASAHADPFVTAGMLKADQDGMPGEETCRGEVDMGGGMKLPFRLDVTAKGNGGMTLANLKLRIYDDHDDGMIYDTFLLNTEIVALDDTGTKYLLISGTAIHTGEKGNERVPESVIFIYRFDRAKKTFARAYKHASFDLEY